MEDEIVGLNISAIYLSAVKTVTQQNKNDSLLQPEESELLIDPLEARLTYWLEGVLLTIIAVAGIIGNSISIIVLSRPELRRSNFNQLLLVLAGYDITYLISSVLIFGLPNLSEYYRSTVYVFTLPVFYGIAHISRVGSALLTLSITIERFVAITNPFFFNMKHIKRFLIKFSVIFSFVYNIPRFFEFSAIKKVELDLETNTEISEWSIEATELRKNPMYMKVYILWLKLVIVEVLPYILIAVLNTIIVIRTRRSSAQFSMVTSNQVSKDSSPVRLMRMNSINDNPTIQVKDKRTEKENRMVTILVIVVIFFITCQSFKLIPDIFEVVQCATGDRSPPECWAGVPDYVSIISMVAHVCLNLNSSANFFIYVVWGNKFRESLLSMICRQKSRERLAKNGENRTSISKFSKSPSRRARYTECHSLTCLQQTPSIYLSAGSDRSDRSDRKESTLIHHASVKTVRIYCEIEDTMV